MARVHLSEDQIEAITNSLDNSIYVEDDEIQAWYETDHEDILGSINEIDKESSE